MTQQTLETDYLVIGSGAMGMAFTDVLMNETDASVVMVDQHHRPGGHWNDSYNYVRLHQPSAFYGVNSKALGSGQKDATGWNEGLYELASGSEVCAYFDQVMHQQFLPSGRVQYFPMCHYQGAHQDEHRFCSTVSDAQFTVNVSKRVVDATYMNVTVPSVRAPQYAVAGEAQCVPLNDLVKSRERPAGYVVVGAGKTGMDACLWLLRNAVDPDLITWIMPRDSWMMDRANIQPGMEFFERVMGGTANQTQDIAQASSFTDLFERLNATGQLLRLSDDVWPTMYRCATVTTAELEQLRRIKNVVRKGRVLEIQKDTIVLSKGSVPTSTSHLHIDCSADGLERRPVTPVFADKTLTLQAVRTCQQVFSAAFIAHVEAAYDDDTAKNGLCQVVPHPNSDVDFLRTTLANTLNQARWSQDGDLQAWLNRSRLNIFSAPNLGGESPGEEHRPMLQTMAEQTPLAVARLQELLAELDG